jgi:hypothetical protein
MSDFKQLLYRREIGDPILKKNDPALGRGNSRFYFVIDRISKTYHAQEIARGVIA